MHHDPFPKRIRPHIAQNIPEIFPGLRIISENIREQIKIFLANAPDNTKEYFRFNFQIISRIFRK